MTEQAAATTTTATDSTQQTTQTTQTAQPASNQPWYGKVEETELGYLQNKGWDKEDGGQKAVKSYRELEKLVGTIKGDPDRIIVMPKDMQNKEEVSAYRAKMGIPNDPKEYGFDENDALLNDFAKIAHEKGMNKEQALAVRDGFNKFAAQKMEEAAAEQNAANAVGLDEFKREVGKSYEQHLDNMRAAAIAYPELDAHMEKLESSMGTKDFMKFMSALGAKTAEAKALGLGEESNSFTMTPAMAKDKLVSFKADPLNSEAIANTNHPAHMAKMAEFNRLYDAAYPA